MFPGANTEKGPRKYVSATCRDSTFSRRGAVTWGAASPTFRGAHIRAVEAKGTQAGLGLSEKPSHGQTGARPSLSGMLANPDKQVHVVGSPSWLWDQNSLSPPPGRCLLNPKLLLPLWVDWLIKTGGQPHQGGSGLASCLFVTLRAVGHSHVQQSNRTTWSEPRVAGSLSVRQHSSAARRLSTASQSGRHSGRLSLQIRKAAAICSKRRPKARIHNAKALGSSRPRALLSSTQRSFPGRDTGCNPGVFLRARQRV